MTCIHRIGTRCGLEGWRFHGVHVVGNVCDTCPRYEGPPRGLGDRVAKVAKSVGILPCGGCQKRREALNAAFPAKDSSV